MLRIRKAASAQSEIWTDLLPSEIGGGLHEDNDYWLELSTKTGARIYVDDVELAKDSSGLFKWRPSFYAGRVTVEVVVLDAHSTRHEYFLDVSPSPAKSGQTEFDEMVADIRAFDQTLLSGTSSASMEFGHRGSPGRFGLDILLSRLRAHGPAFLSTVGVISNSPHRSLAAEAKLLPLSRIRRLHHSSLRDRRLAALAVGHAPAPDFLDSLQINSQTSTPTFDTPANRALLALLRRFRAVVNSMQDIVRAGKLGSPPEEQSLRIDRRLTDLYQLEARANKLLLGAFMTEISSGETTAAGLTQISAQPIYSRAYRIGSRALAVGTEGGDSADQLHVAPSWGIYETWCFIQVVDAVRQITKKQGTEAASTAVAAERCVSFLLDGGTKLDVLFQATFPALKPSSKRIGWSLSRERRPDIVLVHTGADGIRSIVLDAKWRSGRENVLDAMQSAHIYHDALRMGSRSPAFALLLLPGSSVVPALETDSFIRTHAVGSISDIRAANDATARLVVLLKRWLSQLH